MWWMSAHREIEHEIQPLVSDTRFTELRDILRKTKYPAASADLLRALGGEEGLKWVVDFDAGKGGENRHFSYFAIDPDIAGAGQFCVELQRRGLANAKERDEIIGARLCFLSRFGRIFYEDPRE